MKKEFIKRLAVLLGEKPSVVNAAMKQAYKDMLASKMFTQISETTKEDLEERELWKEERCGEPMQKFISINVILRK